MTIAETAPKHSHRDGGDVKLFSAAASAAAGAARRMAAPPSAPPPFSVAEVRAAVPKHCFQRSALHSFAYLFLVSAVCGVRGVGVCVCSSFSPPAVAPSV